MNQSIQQSSNDSQIAKRLPDKQRFAFVHSAWHREIVHQGRDAFLAEMIQRGVSMTNIDVYEVLGAFEIPLHVKLLALTNQYAAITACGFIVDGGIYRHDFVAGAVIDALMRVQLETEVPVISAVLTPQRFNDHEEHRRFFSEHLCVKGQEAAVACISAVASLARIGRVADAA